MRKNFPHEIYAQTPIESVMPLEKSKRHFSIDSLRVFDYQIKIYHLKNKAQEQGVDKFLQEAYLPAMYRAEIKNIGVLKPISKDTSDQLIYSKIKSLPEYLNNVSKNVQIYLFPTVCSDF